jgi:hypothetical protein
MSDLSDAIERNCTVVLARCLCEARGVLDAFHAELPRVTDPSGISHRKLTIDELQTACDALAKSVVLSVGFREMATAAPAKRKT